MAEEMAVMSGVHVGMRDAGRPILWFEVDTLHGGALQVMGWEEASELIKEADCYKLKDLEGAACVVERDNDNGTLKYVRMLKPKGGS